MSPRAAWRLESLGFTHVYDYIDGMADWLAFGQPTEGTKAALPRAGNVVQRDVPVCLIDDDRKGAIEHARQSGWGTAVVVNAAGIVLGRIHANAQDGNQDQSIELAMESGPTTVRPSELLDGLVERMQKHGVDQMLVTTLDGRLVGVMRRTDAEQFLDRHEQ